MECHDTSQIPKYMEFLEEQRQILKDVQSRKGQPAKPTKSRDEINKRFIHYYFAETSSPVDKNAIRTSFVPPAYPPSIEALSDLKKALIKDLTIETHHRGSYTLLRAVTPAFRKTGIMAVVEDEEGDVLTLQLYNQDRDLVTDGRLVDGTIMLIKEPYLKVMGDGDYGLRVDHLSDIRFILENDPLVPAIWRDESEDRGSANSWRKTGNNLYELKEYHLALNCYSKALDCSTTPKDELAPRLNRAQTFLKTNQFDAALRDVEHILSKDKFVEKALFRKAQALYYLQRYQQSCDVYVDLCKAYPNNATAKSEFARATARLFEQRTGEYPFKQMQQEATKLKPPHFDLATYIGPVAVRPSTHGRGLFTTQAVRAGDLLICEKAFAHAFHDDGDNTNVSILVYADTNSMKVGTQAELNSLIARKLQKNPSLIPAFNDLYHGSYTPVGVSEVDGSPVVDTFLVERIMSLNGFGCSTTSRTAHIARVNADNREPHTEEEHFDSSGVWRLASYVNHSCYPNTHRAFIGDMMVVRATQDLPANTELKFWYRTPVDDGTADDIYQKYWGFQCDCVICKDVRETGEGNMAKRRELMAASDSSMNIVAKAYGSSFSLQEQSVAITMTEAAIVMIEKTYRRSPLEVPRLGICKTGLFLAEVHATHGRWRKAIGYAIRTLESLGYVIEGWQVPYKEGRKLHVKRWGLAMDVLVRCWMILCRAYGEVAPELADQAEYYARTTYRICIGEDETFEDTYNRSSHRVDGMIVHGS
ncbi:hypothetical protein CBS63078_7047 [Aspergillus niger]|nr:hypothetical protein CBS63078_7047 [Aspergillus niger]